MLLLQIVILTQLSKFHGIKAYFLASFVSFFLKPIDSISLLSNHALLILQIDFLVLAFVSSLVIQLSRRQDITPMLSMCIAIFGH